MCVNDTRLDGRGMLELRRRLKSGTRLWEVIVDCRVALDPRDIRSGSQFLGNRAGSPYQDCVNNIERAMPDFAFAQPLQNHALRALSLVQQSAIHVASLLSFGLQTIGPTQVSLISEHNEKFCLLAIGGMFHHPGSDFLFNST